ncbi:MAG: hypothetical protein WD716_02520 [Fimbriimonadaceae bacterium]
MTRILFLALLLGSLAGCSTVEDSAEEGKQAFQTGMRSSEKAREFGEKKESYDSQSDEF